MIPPISEPAIQEAGNSFLRAANASTDAWNVALDFAGYRTTLNSDKATQGGRIVRTLYPGHKNGPLKGGDNEWVEITGYEKGIFLDGRIGDDPEMLIIDETGRPAAEWTNIIFRNERLIYRGGRIKLNHVLFINCSFEFSNVPQMQDLAKSILSNPVVSLN